MSYTCFMCEKKMEKCHYKGRIESITGAHLTYYLCEQCGEIMFSRAVNLLCSNLQEVVNK